MTVHSCLRGNIRCGWPFCGCPPNLIDVHLPEAGTFERVFRAAAAHAGEPDVILSYAEFCRWETVLLASHS